MLVSIDSASHWVILAKDIERFRHDLPILPLNENVVSRTLVFWIGSSKRTFVADNTLEVPESITIFVLMLLVVLLNVVHQLIVGKDLFVVIIIDRANKLYVSRLPEAFMFVFANTFANLLFNILRIRARCCCPSSLSMRKVQPISSEGSMTGIGGKISPSSAES
jgi:hypothetical protein